MAGKFCVECGKQIGFYGSYGEVTSLDRSNFRWYEPLTKYCSKACKQKAYRKRLKLPITKDLPGNP